MAGAWFFTKGHLADVCWRTEKGRLLLETCRGAGGGNGDKKGGHERVGVGLVLPGAPLGVMFPEALRDASTFMFVMVS